MPDKVKEIIDKIQEWWKHFTSRQRTIIISIVAVTIFAMAIVVYTTSRPQYVELISCANSEEASEVVGVLDGAGILYKASADGLDISVESSQEASANWALGAAGYVPDSYTIDDALGGGMTTTAADREKRYTVYLEKQLESDIKAMYSVKDVNVRFHIPDRNGTLGASQQEASAFIQLELDGTFTSANAANMAKAVASFLGNKTTANITIIDFDSNMLFSGGDDYSTAGIANSMQELQNQAESMVANQVKKVLYGTNQYSNIEVTSHLAMDYASYEKTVKEYYANEGRTEGMKVHEENYEYEASGGVAGVPGTDSNGEADGITYVSPDYGNSSSTENENLVDYIPNEKSEYSVTPAGGIKYGDSSISIAAIKYKEIYEKDAKLSGLLEGTTWEEYKLANSADVKQAVDEEFYTMVANATGIPVDKITIVSYESPVFYDKEGISFSWRDTGSFIVLFLIIGLLAFVVLRSMRGTMEVTGEEELSVENLLQSTPEESVDDIDLETKSATRLMIEKFVDENPEAAASLLRNWLNEDWN